MKIQFLIILVILLSGACRQESDIAEGSSYPTQVVLLADTSAFSPDWRDRFEARLSKPFRLVVSFTGRETAPEVQNRIPWILQSGVDELYVVENDWSGVWLDSLQQMLPATTALKVMDPE